MNETEGATAQAADGNSGATGVVEDSTPVSSLLHTMILPVEGRRPMSLTIGCENGVLNTVTARDAGGAQFAVTLHLRPVNPVAPALDGGGGTAAIDDGTNGEGDEEGLEGGECVECTTDGNGVRVCRPVRCD